MSEIEPRTLARRREYGFAFRSKRIGTAPAPVTVKAVCEAALRAVEAFEQSARQGDSIDRFLSCSEREHRAVLAACAAKAATPADFADKAALLAKIAGATNCSQATLESFAQSVAADAAALAESIATAARKRGR